MLRRMTSALAALGETMTSPSEPVLLATEPYFGRELVEQGPFNVIYADPPWPAPKRKTANANTWFKRRSSTYELMTTKQILAMPVRQVLASENSLLVMWATWMHLALALRTIDTWEFKYVAGAPWLKTTKDGKPIFGLGVWFRGCTELLLIAKRGKFPNPRPARNGIFESQRGPHSQKPDEVRQWIETKMPGPRIELFAREPHDNWSVWGNEV